MSEGGLFSWKVQKTRVPPAGDYSKMSLPPPPAGKTWQQDLQTKEYKLVSYCVVEVEPSIREEEEEQLDDWDLCSDKQLSTTNNNNNCTTASITTQDVFVARAGSVRSINTLDGASSKSGPSFKIQRTHSSSTIDSNEQQQDYNSTLGPSGKGVLGVDYLEHVILPTDTLQGICIAYKISTTRLRQANHFSGNSLLLAPKKLVIPISKKALKSGFIRVQDTDAKEYKLYSFLAEFQKNQFAMTEAKAYLELADWNLRNAIQSAREDVEWEREIDAPPSLSAAASQCPQSQQQRHKFKSGEIRITAGSNKHTFQMHGAGAFQKQQIVPAVSHDVDDDKHDESPCLPAARTPTVYAAVPAISTKTVQPQDVYRAASTQDGNYGVELKDIKRS